MFEEKATTKSINGYNNLNSADAIGPKQIFTSCPNQQDFFCSTMKLLKKIKNYLLNIPDFIVSFLWLVNQIISLKKISSKCLLINTGWCNFNLQYFV